jgi:nucleotide-binding universal stress UspA family protein
MEIKSILFPTDFSEGASHALAYAIDMSKKFEAKLFLLHVIHDIDASTGLHIPHSSVDVMYKELEAATRKAMDKLCLSVNDYCRGTESFVMHGVPYEEILKFVSAKTINMVIMATHGRKGLDRVLFGSTAERVVRNSICPVLTVRMP